MFFAFNHMNAYRDKPHAQLMVNSIRRHMPDSVIMQISDKDMVPIEEVDQIFCGTFQYDENTYPQVWFSMLYAASQLPKQTADKLVCCDADMIFAGDIIKDLEGNYDIAICKREKENGSNTSRQYRIMQPYNIGFMSINNMEVIKCAADAIKFSNLHKMSWDLGQHVIGHIVNSGEFTVRLLDEAIYNRAPEDVNDYDFSVKVWHFKGKRKDFMAEWVGKHGV